MSKNNLSESCLNSSRMLTDREVAETLCVSVASVRRWRLLRQGPRFLKLGSSVRYRREDVDAWLASRPTGGTDVRNV
jgi:excisionase family DNA binding protein